MNLLKPKLRHSTPFRNAKLTNKGESANFAHFNPKITTHICTSSVKYVH